MASTKVADAQWSAPATHTDPYIDENAAGDFLSVNPRTLQQWRLRGSGPRFVRISSRCVRYRISDLIAWAESRGVSAPDESQP